LNSFLLKLTLRSYSKWKAWLVAWLWLWWPLHYHKTLPRTRRQIDQPSSRDWSLPMFLEISLGLALLLPDALHSSQVHLGIWNHSVAVQHASLNRVVSGSLLKTVDPFQNQIPSANCPTRQIKLRISHPVAQSSIVRLEWPWNTQMCPVPLNQALEVPQPLPQAPPSTRPSLHPNLEHFPSYFLNQFLQNKNPL